MIYYIIDWTIKKKEKKTIAWQNIINKAKLKLKAQYAIKGKAPRKNLIKKATRKALLGTSNAAKTNAKKKRFKPKNKTFY